MVDWKAVKIKTYLTLEHEKRLMEEEMRIDPLVLKLQHGIVELEEELEIQISKYEEELIKYDTQLRKLRDELVEGWNIDARTFKCDAGSATLRTTRSLKVDNKETLISTLQKIGKLEQCIKGWDLIYLRKLADAGMFDVDWGEPTFVHYDEKKNVVISSIKTEEGTRR